jgi:predicted GNAT family N-acyltransferase
VVLTCKDHLVHYYASFGFQCQGISASTHGGAVWNDMVLTFAAAQN